MEDLVQALSFNSLTNSYLSGPQFPYLYKLIGLDDPEVTYSHDFSSLEYLLCLGLHGPLLL